MTLTALDTDLYQLTMIASYVDQEKHNETATFDLFIRGLPKNWGYLIAAGVDQAADIATQLQFTPDDLAYLRSTGMFTQHHLEYFKNFRFTGEIAAVPEGSVITANTPIIRVTAPRAEAQLLESILINTIMHPTLVATKASRTVDAAQGRAVVDFGMRRAHGLDAARKGARAAYIGGASATSNVQAGKEYGIPIAGTHAHSYVMSFPSEEDAFRSYCKTFPNNPTLLVDTYDTIEGVKTAIAVGKDLEKNGCVLGAIRLDSGNLETLAKEARALLDNAQLHNVKIIASGDLNEYKIKTLLEKDAPIDAFGVGTELITGKPETSLSAVYKLAEDQSGGKLKLAPGKETWPGKKQVWRVTCESDMERSPMFQYDLLALESEGEPTLDALLHVEAKPLLRTVVRGGWRVTPANTLTEARERRARDIAQLHPAYRSIGVLGKYEMHPSDALVALTAQVAQQHAQHRHILTPKEEIEAITQRWKEVAA